MFWKCTYTQTFWRELNLFFTSKSIPLSCDWNDKTILFGSLVFNLVLLKAKYFIFKQKFGKTSPSFDVFRKIMKSYYNLEKYNAVKNGTIGNFEKAWNSHNALL